MRTIGWIFCVGLLATALTAQGSPIANLGHYYVVAGYAQSAALAVSDAGSATAEDIEGMTFTMQIAAGTASTPAIGNIDFLTNTIWSSHVSAGNVLAAAGNAAQFKSFTVLTDTAGDFVNANGTLAALSFSASAATAPGDYALKLFGTKDPDGDSQFTSGVGNLVPSTFGNGTLTVIAPFDINGDGHVNVADITALMGALANLNGYQSGKNLTAAQLIQVADVNRDSQVNNADLQALITTLANSGGAVSSGGVLAAVPEPGSLVLFLLGATPLILRRKSG